MKKFDFSGIVGGKKSKPTQKKGTVVARKHKPTKDMHPLEKEIHEFNQKPKAEREKEAEKFDFTQVTKQIKEKPLKPKKISKNTEFNPEAVDKALNEKPKEQNKVKLNIDVKELTKEIKKETKQKTSTKKEQDKKSKNAMNRVPSGIEGLDELIEGGFEKNSSILIVGSAGTGKSLFGLQFLHSGAVDYDEPGIFISFEESKESMYKHSSAFGWNFEKLEREGKFKVLEYKPHQVEKLMEQGGGPIRDEIRAMGAKRIVIDSITSYGLLFKDEYQKRENILELFDLLEKWEVTSIIISELPPKVAEVKEGSVGFLTDAIISLYYTKDNDKDIRVHSCEILKMRGTKHTNKLLALGFEKNGLVIYPEVEVF